MATVPKPLHGLSRDVTMAVLPRLYLEEVVLELSRRDINIGGFHTGKEHLVSVLKNLMAREYTDLELEESQRDETGSRDAKDKTTGKEHDLGKQDDSRSNAQRMPGTTQIANGRPRGKESIVQRPANMFLSDQVGQNKQKDGNVEPDDNDSCNKGNVSNEKDKKLAAESNQSCASKNDRIQSAKTAAKRKSSDMETKYFDALPDDVRHHLQFCEARVVLERLEHDNGSGFFRRKKRRTQQMQMTSSVTSSVPRREENSLDNTVPNMDSDESNDFLLEAQQLGYKTRLRWNTIIQSDLQPETESKPKTTAKGKQKIGATSSGRQPPSIDSKKSKQPASPVHDERKRVQPHKESEPKTPAKGKQKVGTTSSGRQPPSKDGKRKQSSPVQETVKSTRKKVQTLKESEPKKSANGRQKIVATSSGRQPPSNDGKSKQLTPVKESVMSNMKKVWFPEESAPKTALEGKQKVATTSSVRKPPSNNKKGIQLTPASESVLSKLKKVQLPKKPVPKRSAKGKQKIGTATTGKPSKDGKSPNPEDAPVRPIIRRNRTKHVYVCEDCGYRSKSRCHMIVHIRRHIGEKPFGCCLCSYRGTSEKNLRVHMQKHTGLERPHVCEYCGYTTGSRNALVKHIRTHTGERPYVCNICGYSAASTSRIADHIRTHTNERTHHCPQCTYRANRRDSLERHYLTHTGDKPHHCKLCDYKSTQKATLNRHVVLMHEKRKGVKDKEKVNQVNHSDVAEKSE